MAGSLPVIVMDFGPHGTIPDFRVPVFGMGFVEIYVATSDPNVVAVLWGNYKSDIMPGGTGKFAKAFGTLSYFGLADFAQHTLVLRYRGGLCH